MRYAICVWLAKRLCHAASGLDRLSDFVFRMRYKEYDKCKGCGTIVHRDSLMYGICLNCDDRE